MWDTQPWYSQLLRMLTDVPGTLPQRSDTLQMPTRRRMTHPLKKNDIDGLQSIRRSLETQGISKRASGILQSWRQGTREREQYASCIKPWIKYCHRKHVSCVDPSISQALDFLVELYDQGVGYSAMNMARSALSCILTSVNGITFGAHPAVTRFLKGAFESRPTV